MHFKHFIVIFDKCLNLMHKVTFPFCHIIISLTDPLPMQEYILKYMNILWLLLILQSSPAYLLEELFLWLLNNNSVSIPHHCYQHVQQQDGDQDLEQHKRGLRHGRVGTRIKIIILTKYVVKMYFPDNCTLTPPTSYSPSVMWKRATHVVWYLPYRSPSRLFMMK